MVIFLPKTNSLKIQGKGARYDLIEKRDMESYLGEGEEGNLEPSPAFLLVYCRAWEFLLQQYVTGIIKAAGWLLNCSGHISGDFKRSVILFDFVSRNYNLHSLHLRERGSLGYN